MFDVGWRSSHRVDSKARVSVRSVHYSVPVRLVHTCVDVVVSADTVEAFDGSKLVASHCRGCQGDEILSLDHYLEVLAVKPGAMPGATALRAARKQGAFTVTHDQFWVEARRQLGDRDGTKALIEVLLSHRRHPAKAVTSGIINALKVGSVDPTVVAIEARRATETSIATVIPIGAHTTIERPIPTLDAYDQLLENTP